MNATALFSFAGGQDSAQAAPVASPSKKDDDSESSVSEVTGDFEDIDLSNKAGVPLSPRSDSGSSTSTNDSPSRRAWANSEECYQCKAKFGIFLRRHHCRLCGKSVCHEHSSRLNLQIKHVKAEQGWTRTCHTCKAMFRKIVRANATSEKYIADQGQTGQTTPEGLRNSRRLAKKASFVNTKGKGSAAEVARRGTGLREPDSPLQVRSRDDDSTSSDSESDSDEEGYTLNREFQGFDGGFLMGDVLEEGNEAAATTSPIQAHRPIDAERGKAAVQDLRRRKGYSADGGPGLGASS